MLILQRKNGHPGSEAGAERFFFPNGNLYVKRLTVNRLAAGGLPRLAEGEDGLMAKKPASIKDVASLAGVSTATVSNVFSRAKPVNPDLAAKVLKAAQELDYQINRAASELRSGRSKIVTLLVPDLADPFFTSLFTEIESRAEQDGYEIIVANSRDNAETERTRLDALISWKPSGMIVVPCSDILPARLKGPDVPAFVVADRVSDLSVTDTVAIDNRAAGTLAAEHLCQLGHRHIVVVASNLGLEGIRERTAGAREAVQRWGGVFEVVEVGAVPDIGAARLAERLDQGDLPTALIGVTDMTTLAILRFLADRQMLPGDDVSVIGFDDYPWMSARRTPLTVVRQPVEGMADSIWKQLVRRMGGLDGPPTRTVHTCTLEVRSSTQRIAAQAPQAGDGPKPKEHPSGLAPEGNTTGSAEGSKRVH